MKSNKKQALYRYRHLHGEHLEWTKQILTESILYFSSPSYFNDPFDCRIHYRNHINLQQLRQYYYLALGRSFPHLSPAERKAMVAAQTEGLDLNAFITKMNDGLQESVYNIGVLSLSATYSNNLLWSHYAASHSGICLKFTATERTPFFGFAQQVEYRSEYPEIDLLEHSPEEHVRAFLVTKAKDWEYEREWRILDHESGPGPKAFPEDLLVEVIFGARMSERDKETVLRWISMRNAPVKVTQAYLSPGAYALKFKAYNA